MRWIWLIFVLVCACRAPASWPIGRWGSLHEALHEGKAKNSIELGDANRPSSVGLGIGEGLTAEIVVVDGETWVGRSEGEQGYALEFGTTSGRRVAFLALAEVERWREIEVERDVSAHDFEAWLERIGREHALGDEWPFVIRGRLEQLETHILRGACPRADPSAPAPARPPWKSANGRLVGFFARDSAGVLTHSGERTHTHVVLDRPTLFVGHVDSVAVRAGSTLRLPVR